MKRSLDNRTEIGRLPSFLDEADRGADALAPDATVPEPGAGGLAETAEVQDDAQDPDEHGGPTMLDEGEYDVDAPADEEPAPVPLRHSRRAAARQFAPHGGGSGTLALVGGVLLLVVAIAANFVPALSGSMQGAGLTSGTLLAVGGIVAAIGVVQRRTSQLQRRFDEAMALRQDADDDLRQSLGELLGAHRTSGAATGEPGDLQHLLLAVQRQDQKINNLTRAIKMYGKPLMEIAAQGTEIAGSVAQVRTLVEGGAETTRLAVNRLETEVRARSGKTDLGQLPQQVGRIEVSLAALAQRVEHSELHKSLGRLEDASAKAHAELQQLLRGDNVRKATDDLQQRLDKATQGLADGLRQLRDGNLGTLENAVRDIQREVAGLATSVAQIQAAVRSGGRPATAVAAPPSPPIAPIAPEAPAAAPARGEAPAAADGDADATAYRTGKHTSGGKNVLGAIAKLKQMKG